MRFARIPLFSSSSQSRFCSTLISCCIVFLRLQTAFSKQPRLEYVKKMTRDCGSLWLPSRLKPRSAAQPSAKWRRRTQNRSLSSCFVHMQTISIVPHYSSSVVFFKPGLLRKERSLLDRIPFPETPMPGIPWRPILLSTHTVAIGPPRPRGPGAGPTGGRGRSPAARDRPGLPGSGGRRAAQPRAGKMEKHHTPIGRKISLTTPRNSQNFRHITHMIIFKRKLSTRIDTY